MKSARSTETSTRPRRLLSGVPWSRSLGCWLTLVALLVWNPIRTLAQHPEFLTNGLVAYYPFNGNANDESGNGNMGIFYGTKSTQSRFDNDQSARNLNGISDYIEFPGSAFRIFGSQKGSSIAFWIKPDQLGGALFTKGLHAENAASLGNQYLSTQIWVDGVFGYFLYWWETYRNFVETSKPITVKNWHHVTFVRDVQMRAYLDGVNVSSKVNNQGWLADYNANAVISSNPLRFGRRDFADANPQMYFKGSVDDIRIYNRALSDTEVAALYAYESVPPVPTVVMAPPSQTLYLGNTLSLTAQISGQNLSYRWQKDGVDLADGSRVSGATTQSLTITGVTLADAGQYRLTSSNSFGNAVTAAATVTVQVPPPPNLEKMALIPAGVFTMGDERVAGATPVHPVDVSAFAMDRTEVTAALWNEVRTWALAKGYDLTAGESWGNNHPIHNVNWFDVVKWCNARSEKEGLVPAYYVDEAKTQVCRIGDKVPFVNWNAGYRLPTEAEWEKAARGGVVGRLYPWADSDEISNDRSNYNQNQNVGRTTPVGSYPANGFGLRDMAGNVWEWCWDWRAEYPGGLVTDPRGPASGSVPLIRGGSWINPAEFCRVAYRFTDTPANRNISIGFRVVQTVVLPVVGSDPSGKGIPVGQTLSLTAQIIGQSLAYRWQKDGVDLADGGRVSEATTETLTITGVTPADAGQYRLTASNPYGNAATAAATIAVQIPPAITQQPESVDGIEGDPITLSISATGLPAPTFQWFKNGVALDGQTASTLEFPALKASDAGSYHVVVSNPAASVASAPAVVTFQPDIHVLANGVPVRDVFRTLNPVLVELQYANPDWLLYYTLDGSTPDFLSRPYAAPFQISSAVDLRVVAYSPDFSESYLGRPLAIRFLQPQAIDWGTLPPLRFGDGAPLTVTSSSGLPVVVSVVSGPAEWTGTQLRATGAGEVVLRAVQAGAEVFAPVSAERTVSIGRAVQTLAWPGLPDRKFGDAAFGVTVTSSSGLPVAVSVASGKASVTAGQVTLTGAGTVRLSAIQAGDGNREPVTEERTFTVAKADQTLTFPTIPLRAYSPDPFTPTAVSSSKLPVVFEVLSGPLEKTANGLRATGVGSAMVRATQPGNEDYEPALPVDRTLTLTQATQTLTFTPVGPKTFGDAPVTLQATSSAGLPVTFRVNSGPGTVSDTVLTLTGAGTVVVQATQSGTANYAAAAAVQSVTVAKATQSLTFNSIANQGYSTNPIALVATTTSPLAVSFRVVGGPATVSGATLKLTGTGAITVAADQSGDANWLAATSRTNTFTVSRGDQTLTFAPIGDQVLGSGPVTLRATSSAGLPVVFVVLSGPATVQDDRLTLINEGTVVVRARQPGSPLYNLVQADQTFQIKKLTTLTLSGLTGGSIRVDPAKERYEPSDSVTVQATAAEGFEFTGWTGDLTGSVNPTTLVMSANRTVGAAFKDVAAPVPEWDLPVAGTTGNERVVLVGRVTDNVAGVTATWRRDGGTPQALPLASDGTFRVEGLKLAVGDNTFAVSATDAAGNTATLERIVTWVPERVLRVTTAAEVQEGQRLVFPVELSADAANVAGLNFRLLYNPVLLTDPQVEWGALVGQSVNNLNLSTAGEVTGSFALAGVGLPSGTSRVATISFRARSGSGPTNAVLTPTIVSIGSPSGAALITGNAAVSGEGRVLPRKIRGDNNANQRIDVGDAVVISRLQVGLEEVRPWDVPLNDLNDNQLLDNGDIIKALRYVVGLDAQPKAMPRSGGEWSVESGALRGEGPVNTWVTGLVQNMGNRMARDAG